MVPTRMPWNTVFQHLLVREIVAESADGLRACRRKFRDLRHACYPLLSVEVCGNFAPGFGIPLEDRGYDAVFLEPAFGARH